MKALERNKQTFYYALPTGTLTDVIDEDGFYTGEQKPAYAAPVKAEMNISPATGRTALEWFGVNEAYDKVLVTDDIECPINEATILWVDTTPEIIDGATETPYDYMVARVARSLNSVVIGIKKVSVSA